MVQQKSNSLLLIDPNQIWTMPGWMEKYRPLIERAVCIQSEYEKIENLVNYWDQSNTGKYLTANYARGLIIFLHSLLDEGKLRETRPEYEATVDNVIDACSGEPMNDEFLEKVANDTNLNLDTLKQEILISGILDGWLIDEYFQ